LKEQLEVLKEEKLKLSMKHTILEHMVKISIIIDLNNEFTNTRYYEQLLITKARYKTQIFELKKE
jgi:hypothetical protein